VHHLERLQAIQLTERRDARRALKTVLREREPASRDIEETLDVFGYRDRKPGQSELSWVQCNASTELEFIAYLEASYRHDEYISLTVEKYEDACRVLGYLKTEVGGLLQMEKGFVMKRYEDRERV